MKDAQKATAPRGQACTARRRVIRALADPSRHTDLFMALIPGGRVEDRRGQIVRHPQMRSARINAIRRELQRVYKLSDIELAQQIHAYRQPGGPGRVNSFLRDLVNPNAS